MKSRAQIRMLEDGRRLHLHDGPIDLIVEAFGTVDAINAAYRAAAVRFVHVLDELCSELTLLRQAARTDGPLPSGAVARRMVAAVLPYCERAFITPMAAVAGAVAEEILDAMKARRSTFSGLREQRWRHRPAPRARRAICRGNGRAAGSSIAFRNSEAGLCATSPRHCHQRLARTQFFPWNR